ncbi:Heme sensor protein HssS [Paenibacillus plantiphilus]|uniref:Heme sensor protein HssS n=1 Tax=Paenibacillus plantiphilus TaxID=2905650 RepID=A0ABN8H0H9_9BACL|nr:HAMP domain-containing sensor histidine kinase [Paenibacillus plantiphilus]CAH1217399.1 Heme sensor protein HssS [Paenibacillus plantiphilus]
MKTLYVRIVMIFALIALVSSLLGLVLSAVYYESKLRSDNERKIVTIAQEIKALYEVTPQLNLHVYLTHIAEMGFQIYAVDKEGRAVAYGAPFKRVELDRIHIQRVLQGEVYNGISEEGRRLPIIGLFENSVRNTIGIPVQAGEDSRALFIRPNLVQQIGEVRILMAVLLVSTFLISLVLIVVLTRFIVKPVTKLTAATKEIVGGNFEYKMELDIARDDEIGNLARHFAAMAQSLKRLDEMRQQFVADVSHEIQSPLTSIQGFVQAILDKDSTPEEAERYLQIIGEESHRLSSLSKQLLTLAALDKQSSGVNRTEYRLDEQLRQILIMLEWQWTDKQREIELDLPPLMIAGDESMLYQVWLNLISNSIKYTGQGDKIMIEAEQSAASNQIIVRISDTGIGIPEAELPNLFERFYKADKARNRANTGSGLGLSIAREIVSLHQGTIEIQSEYDAGTTVVVRLPQ